MRVWRIVRAAYAVHAFDGEGARVFGGRWNSPGVRMTYTSSSLALAVLETFVNVNPAHLPGDLLKVSAELPDDVRVEHTPMEDLPHDWNHSRSDALRRFGDGWARRGASVALVVPSAVVEEEMNVLLNPAHADMARIAIAKPSPFSFDARMFEPRR